MKPLAGSRTIVPASVFDTSEPVTVQPDIINPAPSVKVGIVASQGYEFANAQDIAAVVGVFTAPRGIDISAPVVVVPTFFISVAGGAPANVRLEFGYQLWAPGGGLVGAGGSLNTMILNSNVVGNMFLTGWGFAFIAPSNICTFFSRRLGTDAADTFTGRIAISPSFRFEYRKL